MRFSLDPIVLPEGKQHRTQDNRLVLDIGTQNVLLRVMSRAGTYFERVGSRFVKRRWLFGAFGPDGKRHFLIDYRECRWRVLRDWDNVPDRSIVVGRMTDAEMDDLVKENGDAPHKLSDWDDHAGGRWGQYYPPYHRTEQDSLWIN